MWHVDVHYYKVRMELCHNFDRFSSVMPARNHVQIVIAFQQGANHVQESWRVVDHCDPKATAGFSSKSFCNKWFVRLQQHMVKNLHSSGLLEISMSNLKALMNRRTETKGLC